MRRYLRVQVLAFAGLALVPRTVRFVLYRLAGLDINTRSIADGCRFFGPGVSIARGCRVNVGCLFDSSASITIGPRTHLGPRVNLITSTHELGDPRERAGEVVARPIWIGAGCWIGAGVTILPGAWIGDGCVIGAGAVVIGDCAPGLLYVGVPARARANREASPPAWEDNPRFVEQPGDKRLSAPMDAKTGEQRP